MVSTSTWRPHGGELGVFLVVRGSEVWKDLAQTGGMWCGKHVEMMLSCYILFTYCEGFLGS